MHTGTSSPDIELLRTFAVFAEHREVTATARTLGMSASVVSRRLQELQADPPGLLTKHGNAVVLTDKGTAALSGVVRLLREYDHLAGRLAGRESFARTLRVAAGGGLAYTPLPLAVSDFRHSHPDVQVRVVGCRGRERIRGVAGGQFNLALVCHDEGQVRAVAGEWVNLQSEIIREQQVVVVAAMNSKDGRTLAALSPDKPVPPEMLSKLSLLGLDEKSGIRRQLDVEFRAVGMPVPKPAVYPGGWEAARAFARHGLGAAILPVSLIETSDSSLVTRPVFAAYRLTDRVIWPADTDELTVAFVACLKAAFA